MCIRMHFCWRALSVRHTASAGPHAQAMARAAGLAAGVAASTVAMPAYAASTAEVKMGSDSGQLVFVPAKTTICAGDTVKWYVLFLLLVVVVVDLTTLID